ncbi:hypothetical protein BV20DRAFT_932901 [Pilatotrama ljubarskyi]|nr:hypothetical protein BV20DRAFT_932901 [Pilatotrama ljubarskyi]
MCKGANWKREVVPDHKFDFIDTREFRDNGCGMRMKYLWLYIGVLISFLVYVSDIFTAVTMLTTTSWSNAIFNSCPPDQQSGCVYIPFSIGRWLFFGCVVFSFLLLAYEAYKAKKIIQSRDISYAFTNVMANKYYSLRSYDHFCFFNHISASTKRMDDFAFFVFFTFKSWKRLLFADGPRQSINALTLYAFYLSKEDDGPFWQISKYFNGNLITSALTVSTAFTVFIFALSLLMLIIAGICYIPLLCHIQGNLKEYCCHKVDKRISEIIKRRNKQRLAKAAALAKKEAAGDFSHLKNKKGELIAKPLPQPTLPNVSLDDDDDVASIRTRGPPPSTFGSQSDYYSDYKAPVLDYGMDNATYAPLDYPPMPAYAQQGGGAYHQYNGSIGTLPDTPQAQMYDDEYASQLHLPSAAAPFGQADDHHSSMQHSAYGGYESYDPYRAGSAAPDYRSGSAAPDYRSGSVAPDYQSGTQAPSYRTGSAAPDYRSASTAPYAQQQRQHQHQQQGQYQQDEYPNPYSPGPHNMFQPAQHGYQQHSQQHQQYQPQPQQRLSGGSDGYDYSAGHVHAM